MVKSQPKNWRKVKLGDICRIKTGKTDTQDAVEGGVYPLFDRSITIKRSDKFLFDTSAIILPGEGQEFAPRFYGGKFDLHQRVYAIFCDKEKSCDNLSLKFLYYFLSLNREYFAQTATGATVKSLRLPIIADCPVVLPPFPTQKQIADILSTYDNLIENNTKRIKILEEIAQTIYKEWFVKPISNDELPKKWKILQVEALVKRVSPGKLYDNKSAIEKGRVPILDQGKSGIIGYHNDEPGVTASMDNPVIVFANHTCYQRLILFPFSAIQNILPFYPSEENYRDIFWLHYATKDLIEFNDYKGHWPEFMQKEVVVPPAELAEKFGAEIKPLVVLSYRIELANQNLRQARDLLLPKLVTGEIQI